MTTKTCEKCGWVLAVQDPLTHCPICGTRFKIGVCPICKQVVEYYRNNRLVCKCCYDTVTRKPDADFQKHERRRKRYAEWLERIKLIPKDYPTLTEKQWYEAVQYFNGCALCENERVDTRWYFIPLKSGGRYCDWNIIPVCEKCATKIRRNYNYFLWERPVGLENTVKYLEEKINGAIAKNTENADGDNS